MKNKEAQQAQDRKKHREQLKGKRKTEPTFERPDPQLIVRPSILIVCEGKNTEPSYFNQFRMSSAIVKSVGEGYNTLSLVNRAKVLAGQGKYDQVWCVFDKDDFKEIDFNKAITVAESNGYGVAYSNQAFEYWLLLHFDDHQGGGMSRSEYHNKINGFLNKYGIVYDGVKSKKIERNFFDLLNGFDEKTSERRLELAILRAKRNYARFDHTNPSREESSTTVYKLVEELTKYQ